MVIFSVGSTDLVFMPKTKNWLFLFGFWFCGDITPLSLF